MIEVGFSNPSFSFDQFGRKELYLGQAFRRRRDMARPLLGQVSAQKSVIVPAVIKEISE